MVRKWLEKISGTLRVAKAIRCFEVYDMFEDDREFFDWLHVIVGLWSDDIEINGHYVMSVIEGCSIEVYGRMSLLELYQDFMSFKKEFGEMDKNRKNSDRFATTEVVEHMREKYQFDRVIRFGYQVALVVVVLVVLSLVIGGC